MPSIVSPEESVSLYATDYLFSKQAESLDSKENRQNIFRIAKEKKKQAEYKASRNEAKRCIARIQAEVMKKQAETLDSKEGRQNIFRIAKQKKKERI